MEEAASLPQIYDTPQLRYFPKGSVLDHHDMGGQPILVDVYGRVILPVTSWLRHLREHNRSLDTVRVYARRIHDFFTFLFLYDGGRGKAWETVDDNLLAQWKLFLLGPPDFKNKAKKPPGFRYIAKGTFNGYLRTILQFYLYAQKQGWASGMIGEADASHGSRYKILVEYKGDSGSSIWHHLIESESGKPEVQLPSDQVLDEILAEIATRPKRPALAERDLLINEWMQRCFLRRSEAVRLRLSQIPSRKKLEALENQARDEANFGLGLNDGAALVVPIRIEGAKKGGPRIVHAPLSLLMRTRDWIDDGREQILAAKRKPGQPREKPEDLFLSLRTGAALEAQSVTNGFKIAAKSAEEKYPDTPSLVPHGKVRPHHNRHLGITDTTAGLLSSGMSETEAKLTVMELAGIKRWETATIYIHMAQRRQHATSNAGREFARQRNSDIAARTRIDHSRTRAKQDKQYLVQSLDGALAEGLISRDEVEAIISRHPAQQPRRQPSG